MVLLDKGARRVTYGELETLSTPPATGSWHPIGHAKVLSTVLENLDMLWFEIKSMDLAIAKEGRQFFGTLDITSEVAEGVRLAVGVRNSVDKSLSAAMCCGERVIVCSNLMFGAEIQIARKHTANVERDFGYGVLEAIKRLRDYQRTSGDRVGRLRGLELTDDRANSLILSSFETGIVGARLLPALIKEWREPSYEEFQPRTAWSLLNCYTTVLKDRQRTQPVQAAMETVAFQEMLAV
jgi:hypothetical protein